MCPDRSASSSLRRAAVVLTYWRAVELPSQVQPPAAWSRHTAASGVQRSAQQASPRNIEVGNLH